MQRCSKTTPADDATKILAAVHYQQLKQGEAWLADRTQFAERLVGLVIEELKLGSGATLDDAIDLLHTNRDALIRVEELVYQVMPDLGAEATAASGGAPARHHDEARAATGSRVLPAHFSTWG